jgi:MFS family permease
VCQSFSACIVAELPTYIIPFAMTNNESVKGVSDKGDISAEHDETVIAEPSFLQSISYGPSGIQSLSSSAYIFGVAVLASLGGFSMGYDMGVISIINVMDQFHKKYPFAKSDFGTELMTAMLLLGAFVGCLFMPYMADKYSRKWALTVVVIIFDIGAILQTAASNYACLVVGRFIGGVGVGTLAMVITTLLARHTRLLTETYPNRAHHFIFQKFLLPTFVVRCWYSSLYP